MRYRRGQQSPAAGYLSSEPHSQMGGVYAWPGSIFTPSWWIVMS
jgi:hypothetical protein